MTVEAWKTAGSYTGPISSTIAEAGENLWERRLFPVVNGASDAIHKGPVEKRGERVHFHVQFRRLSNATWIFPRRCAKDGSSCFMASTRSRLWITVE